MFLFFLGNGAWSIKCRKDVVLSDWKLSCLGRSRGRGRGPSGRGPGSRGRAGPAFAPPSGP